MGRKKNNSAIGEQWCPECHIQMIRQDEGYWLCPECGNNVTDDDVELGLGCSTLEEALQEEYERWYGNRKPDEAPEGCSACGGPYPDCMSSCNLFADKF